MTAMKRILGLSLALALGCGTHAAAQNGPPQQRPAGAPQQRPGGPPGGAPQQAAGEIRGTVLDAATGRPLASASVAVRSAADSSLVGGAVTRGDGSFRVQGLRPGRYFLRTTHLGHSAAVSAAITVADRPASVPPIRLAVSAVQLEGVTATAERSEVRMSADRNTYAVRDMPTASGGNATDVLRNVPAVEVDQDGRVSLRGNQNVAVQINGRAAPMRGDQLGQFLQQLPAGMVDRVEVVPNPSAKYDPEGMAGIVNIVMKQNVDLGLSGGTTLSAGTNNRYNGSGNLGYQAGRMTLFGSYGFFADGRQTRGFNNRTNLDPSRPDLDVPLDYLNQLNEGEGRMRSHTLNTSAEMKFNPANSLASTLLLSTRNFSNDVRNDFRRLDASRAFLAGSDDVQELDASDMTMDGTLSYRRVVKARENELTAEARYNRSNFDQGNEFLQQLVDARGNRLGVNPGRTRNLNDAVNTDMYLQTDLTRMVSGVRVETGYKGQFRQVDNDLVAERFGYESNSWLRDPSSNRFEIDEQVHAGYGVLTRNTGKLELQGGVRVERTSRGTNRADDDLEPFVDLFPSGLAAYNIGATRQVKASYSRRIQRPQTQLLNSFLQYEDPLTRFRGNPYLRPEYTDAYELGFQQSGRLGSVQVTPFYRHTTGAIRRIRTAQGDTITSTVANIATADSYGGDVTASLRAGRVTGFVALSAFQQETDGSNLANSVSSAGFGWSTRANASIRMSAKTDVQVFGMYRAPMDAEQGRIGRFAMANFAVRHKLMNDKASVTFRVQDPFNTMRFTSVLRSELAADDLRQPGGGTGQIQSLYLLDSERRFGARGAFVSFNYTFGQAPRIRAPRPQEQPADPSAPPLGGP